MGEVWYSRRPEVAELAKRATMAKVEHYRKIAADLEYVPNGKIVREPGTGIPLRDIFLSVAQELELRLTGATVIDLAPADPCPDPTRLFSM